MGILFSLGAPYFNFVRNSVKLKKRSQKLVNSAGNALMAVNKE